MKSNDYDIFYISMSNRTEGGLVSKSIESDSFLFKNYVPFFFFFSFHNCKFI